MKTLFDECIEALHSNVEILDVNTSTKIVAHMTSLFPFSKYGRIQWSNVENKKESVEIISIKDFIDISRDVYIIWDNGSHNVLKSSLNLVLENIYDVLAVGFDTWLMDINGNYVIEHYHSGDINVAFK